MEIKTSRDFHLEGLDSYNGEVKFKEEYVNKKWVAVDDLIKEIDVLTDRIICIPNYSDGETHVQYAFRYGKLMQKVLKDKLTAFQSQVKPK